MKEEMENKKKMKRERNYYEKKRKIAQEIGEEKVKEQKQRKKIPVHPLLVHAPWPLMQRHQLQPRRQRDPSVHVAPSSRETVTATGGGRGPGNIYQQ